MRALLAGTSLLSSFAIATMAHATAMPSYSCVFTEPFIGMDSFPGGVRYQTPETSENAKRVALTGSTAKPVVSGTLGSGKSFSLLIVKKPGSDGMSDFVRPYTGQLSGLAIGQPLEGACLKYPDGTTPRRVIGVVDTDKLNVRSKPAKGASVVARVGPGGSVWAFPQTTRNGWARVAVAKYPAGEDGNVTVVTGWVRTKFLGGL